MSRFPSRAVATALVLLGAAAPLVMAELPGALANDSCATYVPERCLFNPNMTVADTPCKPVACSFDTATAFRPCAFPATGNFVTTPAPFCADPFMSIRRVNATACGKDRCCLTDLRGTFFINGKLPTGAPRFEFRPIYPVTCRFAEMTRGQVMALLERIKAPLVIMGDSMMRQLYLRLIMMMRGQQRLLDYKMHTHSAYHTCNEADALRISRNNGNGGVGNTAYDPEYLGSIIDKFFRLQQGPGYEGLRRSLKRCKRAPVKIHYLMAPTYVNQTLAIKRYMESQAKSPSTKPVLVLSVGYWEGNPNANRPAYLETLLSLRKRVSKVFLIGVATRYVTDVSRKETFKASNVLLRNWVAKQGEPFHYVSYDMLTEIPYPRPPAPLGGDKHWMCWTGWDRKKAPIVHIDESPWGALAPHGMPVPQVPEGTLERIQCSDPVYGSDETGRNMWQIILSVLIPPRNGTTKA